MRRRDDRPGGQRKPLDFPADPYLHGNRGGSGKTGQETGDGDDLRHAQMLLAYKGEYTGMREMRKHIAWYTAGFPHSAKLRAKTNEISTMEELRELLTKVVL